MDDTCPESSQRTGIPAQKHLRGADIFTRMHRGFRQRSPDGLLTKELGYGTEMLLANLARLSAKQGITLRALR